MVRDLVCGLPLDADHAVCVDYHGRPYYFCSYDCRVNFEDRPDAFVQPEPLPLADIITNPFKVLVRSIHASEVAP